MDRRDLDYLNGLKDAGVPDAQLIIDTISSRDIVQLGVVKGDVINAGINFTVGSDTQASVELLLSGFLRESFLKHGKNAWLSIAQDVLNMDRVSIVTYTDGDYKQITVDSNDSENGN